MKLSIITINYNNAEGLRKTLASVAAQSYANIQHVIVDGNSSDTSKDIIIDYAENTKNPNHEILWVSEKDKGIYNAMNKGIEIALGRRIVNSLNRSELVEDKNKGNSIASQEYIQILNSGDILTAPDVTEKMMSALCEVKGEENSPAILYGNMIKEYPDGRRVKDMCGGGDYTPESFYYFYRGTLNHDCAYIRKDLFEKYGLYNEELKICSDWEWYVRAIVLGEEKPVYTNIDVTVFDMTGISESDGKNKELIQKERREYLESILPVAVLRDYDMLSLPIEQYRRLKKYHLWGIVYFVERVLFKFEKWQNKLKR